MKEIKVGGIQPLTTIDFPGKLSAVIFCQGCPLNCLYCHNQHLRPNIAESPHSWSEVISFLEGRKDLLDAVVFSGGEPLMQPNLLDAILQVKQMGFEIGLHTAGSYPRRFQEVLPHVDWVGFDIKTDFNDYHEITGVLSSGANAKISLNYLLKSEVNYECRTTVHPLLIPAEKVEALKLMVKNLGVTNYKIQDFRAEGCNIEKLEKALSTFPSSVMPEFSYT